FFFQAEDGIRDFHVTGVQTCALPISRLRRQSLVSIAATGRARLEARAALAAAVETMRPDFAFLDLDDDGLATECEAGDLDAIDRSEERRVGKEGSSCTGAKGKGRETK